MRVNVVEIKHANSAALKAPGAADDKKWKWDENRAFFKNQLWIKLVHKPGQGKKSINVVSDSERAS